MYVCICNAIKEKDLRAVARQHPTECIEELYERLGSFVDCGSCLVYAEHIMTEEQCVDMGDAPSPATVNHAQPA